MIGRRLAHYEIVDLLGRGGMGEVYRARDAKLGRDVAIKVLPREMSGDPERLARFSREARTLAALQHPNVASIYGFEEAEGIRFLVMELAEGEDLSVFLRKGPVPLDVALDIAHQIAEGVEAAVGRDGPGERPSSVAPVAPTDRASAEGPSRLAARPIDSPSGLRDPRPSSSRADSVAPGRC